jgi:hypothetical protein
MKRGLAGDPHNRRYGRLIFFPNELVRPKSEQKEDWGQFDE